MLVRFTVSNCLSFSNKASLEMFSSANRDLKVQVWKSNSRHIPGILRSAFIFGPNASGKSNLIKIIDYARSVILGESNPLGKRTKYFKLNPDNEKKPSSFEFEILIDKSIFRFGFSVYEDIISEEYLYQIISTGEQLIYKRRYDKTTKNSIEFGDNFSSYREDKFLDFILKGVPSNRLFLSETVIRNVTYFQNIFDWFKKMVVIYPDSKFHKLNILLDNDELIKKYEEMLKLCDTGISHVSIDQVDADELFDKIPPEIREKTNNESFESLSLISDERYGINFKNGVNSAYKIKINHTIPSGKEKVSFNIHEESDGTNRLFDLIPILDMIFQDAVIIVDELDRSLHPLVSRFFIETFFRTNQNNKAQLIVTTHDATLLDVSLLRRDSIWFVKKNHEMSSVLYSLEEYKKVRNDKALQKAYLAGLYGAIPLIRDKV
ncbi:MAG TPA: ATP-binding protein [Candidatus Cloacimonadota bacterium]|nr:ATP-binding protein [Candidatus Cloacimonadota bacterium]HOD53526.1 ATP-binding protein [Candidatus Cloacimonadota bacterium]